MSLEAEDARAQAAALVLQRNRAEMRAQLGPRPPETRDAFPRSATFRWLVDHFTLRSIASTAMAAALSRVPFGQIIGKAMFNRKN